MLTSFQQQQFKQLFIKFYDGQLLHDILHLYLNLTRHNNVVVLPHRVFRSFTFCFLFGSISRWKKNDFDCACSLLGIWSSVRLGLNWNVKRKPTPNIVHIYTNTLYNCTLHPVECAQWNEWLPFYKLTVQMYTHKTININLENIYLMNTYSTPNETSMCARARQSNIPKRFMHGKWGLSMKTIS